MMPLYDMSNQTEGCHLLYRDNNNKERIYQYKYGKGAIFGGGLRHSSQPCYPRNDFEKRRPWAFLCFNFGTDRMEYWDILHQNIACSGKLIVQPDGKVAPEASCKSYNAALKEGEKALREEEEARKKGGATNDPYGEYRSKKDTEKEANETQEKYEAMRAKDETETKEREEEEEEEEEENDDDVTEEEPRDEI